MMNIVTITSLDHPDLRPYRSLRQPTEHLRQGIFVAEGEKVVRRLFESTLNVLSVLITSEWLEQYRRLLDSRPERIEVHVADKPLLETIVGFHLHQGIMALGRVPAPATLETVLQNSSRPYFFVALDGLTNSENLGVLVRNCAAFGVQALLVGETSSSPYLRRAVRNSMGAVFTLPVVQLTDLAGTLRDIRSRGIRIIGAHPQAEKNSMHEADFRADCILVFGSEGSGISAAVLEACTERVAVPMREGVDSLNVASASAVFLYEVRRQRGGIME